MPKDFWWVSVEYVCSALDDDPRIWVVAMRDYGGYRGKPGVVNIHVAAFYHCQNGAIIPFKCCFVYRFSKFFLKLEPEAGPKWARIPKWDARPTKYEIEVSVSKEPKKLTKSLHFVIEKTLKPRSISLKSVLLQWQNELPQFDYNCRKRIFGFVQGSLHKFYDNDDFIPTFHVKRKINIDRDAGDIDEIAGIIISYIPVWSMLRSCENDYWTKRFWKRIDGWKRFISNIQLQSQ